MPENKDPIIIGSDHAGLEMKKHIVAQLDRLGIAYNDIGTYSEESTHYPMYAAKVAKGVASGEYKRGITICGTGIGASITANRFRKVRASLCTSVEMAQLTREHNNSNVLVLGGRITTREDATAILEKWLNTAFEGGRHEQRIEMIDDLSE